MSDLDIQHQQRLLHDFSVCTVNMPKEIVHHNHQTGYWTKKGHNEDLVDLANFSIEFVRDVMVPDTPVSLSASRMNADRASSFVWLKLREKIWSKGES